MAIGKVSGVEWANIASFGGVSKANIANLGGGATPPVTATPWSSTLFQFEDQTRNTSTSTTSYWNPSNTHSAWVNGPSAVNGTYWGRTSNKTVVGWNCDDDGTASGNTGPSGGVVIPGGTHSTAASSDMYLYSEVSSRGRDYCFVTRMPGFNFSLEMADRKSNNLNLTFWVHAFGSQIGDLYVYIDTATTSNHSNATELAAYETWSGFTSNSSAWQQKTISLNSYRSISSNHYIYFVTQNATGFRGDLAIDGIQIVES